MGSEKIILGIDPGTNMMGYGLLKVKGNRAEMMAMGVIDMRKQSDPYLRLGYIFERVTGIINEFLPDEMAIEAPFFGKNVQSMLKLGRAQGVAIAQRPSLEGAGGRYASTAAQPEDRRYAAVHGCHRCAWCRLLPFHAGFKARKHGPPLFVVEGFRAEEREKNKEIKAECR